MKAENTQKIVSYLRAKDARDQRLAELLKLHVEQGETISEIVRRALANHLMPPAPPKVKTDPALRELVNVVTQLTQQVAALQTQVSAMQAQLANLQIAGDQVTALQQQNAQLRAAVWQAATNPKHARAALELASGNGRG